MKFMKILVSVIMATCCLLLASCDGKMRSQYVAACTVQGIPKDMCKCAYKAQKKKVGSKEMDQYIRVERMPDDHWNSSMIDAMEECGLGAAAVSMVRRQFGLEKAGAPPAYDAPEPVEQPDPLAYAAPSADNGADAGTFAQCGKDTDCKGDRICDGGQCRTPDTAQAPSGGLMKDYVPSPEVEEPLACNASERPVFACATTNRKRVAVCDDGALVRYVFGKSGEKPEMNLSIPREKVSMSQTTAGQTINLPTGNTVYAVSSGFAQANEGQPAEAGVDVQVGGRHVARVLCASGSVHNGMRDMRL